MANKSTLLERFNSADNYLADKRIKWSEYENLFQNQVTDSISDSTKSRVFDGKLSTLTLDRESRVMAQLPTGKFKAMSKNDEAAEKLMNMTMEKYVLPNANSQYPFLIKTRLVDRYSNIYGNFFTFIDWIVKPGGYIGPDMWLLNIRDVFPQVGAVSLDDSDYIIIRTWRPLSFFKTLKKKDGYKNIDSIIKKLEKKTGAKENKDDEEKSEREKHDYPTPDASQGDGYFPILSMYERDSWTDFVPDADEMLRETFANPHQNNELPVENKYSIPLLDDFMAMGDFERGKTKQYAMNSLWNLSLDAAKYSIFPPTLWNKDHIIPSTLKWGPAAKIMYRGAGISASQVAQPFSPAPQAMSVFNNLYGALNASILNDYGTTDTTVNTSTDPGFGRTPQALKQQAMRENARDNTDRFYMEQFLTRVMKKMGNLLSKKKAGAIQVRLFGPEIEELTKKYAEFKDAYDENTGKLTIDSKKIGNITFDYEMVSGSTFMVDQQKQMENMTSFLEFYTKNAQLVDQKLYQEKKKVSLSDLINRIFVSSGTQDWDKIVVDATEDVQDDTTLKNDFMQFQTVAQQMMGGGMGQVPPMGQPGMEQMGGAGAPQVGAPPMNEQPNGV